ncbi:MAG: hypothetical protein N3D11_05360 [Candidatus Sumerlaeia bacterium]|nr:hypothetical protein [Candidatus Sumerlaeia bacterium]
MKTKEIQQKLVENMKQWKGIENASVASTGRIIEATDNPIVRLIMEIIQRDSQMHYRVQELIADSLETKTISLTPEDIGKVWDMIENHVRLEKETISLARQSLKQLEGKKMPVQAYLLEYLLLDELKHERILKRLALIKKAMYPYG